MYPLKAITENVWDYFRKKNVNLKLLQSYITIHRRIWLHNQQQTKTIAEKQVHKKNKIK